MGKTLFVSFDTEMTDLRKDDDIISIGLQTSDSSHAFYAEVNDFDKNKMSEWVADNVISNLLANDHDTYYSIKSLDEDRDGVSTAIVFMKNTFREVSISLNSWLDNVMEKYDDIQFVSDVSHYDFVHLIDLITNKGSGIDLRKDVSISIIDINQFLDMSSIRKEFNIAWSEVSSDVNREGIVEMIKGEKLQNVSKHNALFDAAVINAIFVKISNILDIYVSHE